MRLPIFRNRLFISAVSVMIVMLLIVPVSAVAKEKRGGKVVVTRLDGRQFEGELLAVRQGSLLLLDWAGNDHTIDLAEIRSVRIKRKSRAGTLALGGLLAGALGGAIYGGHVGDDVFDNPALACGLYFGAVGALAGLALSIPAGLDTTIAVAGEPAELLRSHLDKLARYSREPSIPVFASPDKKEPEPTPRKAPSVPVTPSPSRSRPSKRPRFKITLSTTLSPKLRYGGFQSEEHTFGFPEGVPADEAGPYPVTFEQYRRAGMYRMVVAGPFSLAYEWSEHWASEIEVFTTKPGNYQTLTGTLRFTSEIDGKTYSERLYHYYYADFDSVLFGMTYRPLVPSPLQRHAFEFGAAAGPAWVKSNWNGDFPDDRKVVLSGRVQAAYDFYFIPALSLGACVGYRHIEAKFPAATVTMDLDFVEEGVPYYPPVITRLTEMTIPARTFTRSSFFLAIRAGFRI